MKKIIILLISTIFIGCSAPVPKEDPLAEAVIVTKDLIIKYQAEKDLDYMLKKYDRKWSSDNKNKCIQLLCSGQKEFDIDYRIVLSIIAVESQFDITAYNKNYKKKKVESIDFGLSQQNSKYYKQRYKVAERYLKQHEIKYTSSKYDMAKNIYACFIYLKDISDYAGFIHFRDYITAYNQGVTGAVVNNNDDYYNKFMQEYLSL